MMEFSPS